MPVANKDRAKRTSKKTASRSLKEKRAAKREKKATRTKTTESL
jgi:hypothetical protein